MIPLALRERDDGRPVVVLDRRPLNGDDGRHDLVWWFLRACQAARLQADTAPTVAYYTVTVKGGE